MKRTVNFLVSLALIVGLSQLALARQTGSVGERDAWAVGAFSYEVAVDSTGNIVPTSNATQSLGDRVHLWQGIYVSSLVVISSMTLPDSSVITPKIAALAVDSTKLAASSIDSEKLIERSITGAKLVNLTVDSTKLGALSVDSEKLIERSITGAKLVNLTVDSTKLGALSVDSEKIAKNAVQTEKIRSDSIDTSKMLWGTVGPDSAKILCILGGNSRGFGVCSHSATIAVDGCGNCQ